MRRWPAQFLSCKHKMNPFGSRKYLAEVNRAGQEWEAGQAKGLALLLEDTSQEVLDLRASVEDHYRAEERHRADMHEQLCDLKDKVKQLVQSNKELVEVLNGSSSAAAQVAARGRTQTLSLMEAGQLPLLHQRVPYHFMTPKRGLVGGLLYRLDVWALQLFEKNTCNR